ncbi:extracellular solute-binding protein [Micromonospora sp. KC213]|uniref:ABC transporter substrate-binding protein n=1 Tax=Micromonospora sp. KC213 TaxID=2530378 RepID=UPI00104C3170|nr:extracellular solute-binding protein [Micromonospora sp. KC213]TDC35596.1 extracellular solute-binding protein [Micromonospora sp. KC213]
MNEHDRLTRRLAAMLSEAQDAVPPATDVMTPFRRRYAQARRRRVRTLAVACAVMVVAATVLVGAAWAPGSRRPADLAGPPAGGDDKIQVWTLRSQSRLPALHACAAEFSRGADIEVDIASHPNQRYQQQLREALTSTDPPDIFFHWGGGGMAEMVREKQVLDLTRALRARPEVASAFAPEVLAGGRVDGRQYGLPASGVEPVMLFYNRRVFAQADLRPPETYTDLLALVDAFKARGIDPLALAGADGWSELMYLMYLVDRIGGPRPFADIAAGRPGAWSHPAVLQAARMARELVERGAFGRDFTTLRYDDGGSSGRLASGQAAMQLMGSWEYALQLTLDPDFVRDGDLGWVPFPAVPGGAGDPANVVGVPGSYYSVSSASLDAEQAVDVLFSLLTCDRYVDALLRGGEVPAVTDVPARAAGTPHEEFIRSTHRLAAAAPSLTLAWDQALSPTAGAALNANLRRLFALEFTAEQFAAAMNEAR